MLLRFLDLDLDFFLNQNPYRSECDGSRLGPEYKPWNKSKTRHFLEDRCGLSLNIPIPGRIVESHEEVLGFWHMLIESGKLRIPFEVIHVDAHPDLWVGDMLYMTSGSLHIDSQRGPAIFKRKQVHSGNYLTFAIVYGWVGSLIWIPLLKHLKDLPKWDGDTRSALIRLNNMGGKSSTIRDLPTLERERGVPFKVLPWNKFRTSEAFDYMMLSRSSEFTPSESDVLITVIEGYMKQI